MEIGGGESFEVTSGDSVIIRAGASQRITNIDNTDLLMQYLYMLRLTPDSYEPLE